MSWLFPWRKEEITTTVTCIYFNQISALIYMITKYILIELAHIYMVSQNLHTSIFLYHCWLWILLNVQLIIYNQHFDDIKKFFIICILRMFLSYSPLKYLQYIHITFSDCFHIMPAKKGRGWFWHNLISLVILDQRRGGLNFSIFRQMSYVNDPLLPISSIKLFFTFTLALYIE